MRFGRAFLVEEVVEVKESDDDVVLRIDAERDTRFDRLKSEA